MTALLSNVALAVHGGAGAIAKELVSAERERACHAALAETLHAGHRLLTYGGSSLDAVLAAVVVLEDCPLFNAARGAVLTYDGQVRTDAAVMEGKTLRAGAVTNVNGVRNPILLARAVMDSPHVFLSGEGAVEFARHSALPFEAPEYFVTPERQQEWQDAMTNAATTTLPGLGTVGAVALDHQGNVAAATSTGGMLLKRWGRIGDSPVLGAGTYADNRVGAVSATGYGELFLRTVAAHGVCARMRYAGEDVTTASNAVLTEIANLGGDGGLIVIDTAGNIAMNFNAPGMYRGSIDVRGKLETRIW